MWKTKLFNYLDNFEQLVILWDIKVIYPWLYIFRCNDTYACRFESVYMRMSVFRRNVVIYEAFCLDLAQGHMKGAPNKTRTHACRFASRTC